MTLAHTNIEQQSVTCPYCGEAAVLVDSIEVYGRSYGNIWLCHPCEAWVGVHKNNEKNTPLGRLANAELRDWKKKAHAAFDPLWKRKMQLGFSKRKARGAGYKWLAGQLGIEMSECHVGMFDVEICKRVVEVCRPFLIPAVIPPSEIRHNRSETYEDNRWK